MRPTPEADPAARIAALEARVAELEKEADERWKLIQEYVAVMRDYRHIVNASLSNLERNL